MLYNEDYNRSLWLMLQGKNSEILLNFLKYVPNSLFQDINNALLSLSQCDELSIKDKKLVFSGERKLVGDITYWYSLDIVTGALNIGEMIYDGEDQFNSFHLTVYPLNMDDYKKLGNFDNYSLGDISYDFVEELIDRQVCLLDMSTIYYEIIKFPFGKTVISSKNYLLSINNGYRFVDIDNIPNDYNLNDFVNGNKLVRRRKRNNNSK